MVMKKNPNLNVCITLEISKLINTHRVMNEDIIETPHSLKFYVEGGIGEIKKSVGQWDKTCVDSLQDWNVFVGPSSDVTELGT